MKIGIIGAGSIGTAFAKQVAAAGYDVIISNSRGPESLRDKVQEIGGNTTAGTVEQAAQSDIIFIALQWQHMQQVLSGISLKGKILIDPSNPILPGFVLADLNGKTSSEIVQTWADGAKLVKAFNTLTPQILESNPSTNGGNRVIFYSGNDNDAKDILKGILSRIGFAGIDLGRLDEGGKLQQFPGGSVPSLNLIKL